MLTFIAATCRVACLVEWFWNSATCKQILFHIQRALCSCIKQGSDNQQKTECQAKSRINEDSIKKSTMQRRTQCKESHSLSMASTSASNPGPIHPVHAPAHKRALRAQQKSNHIGRLFSRALPPKGRGIVKGGVFWPAREIPVLLHQGRVDGTGSNAVDADLSLSVLEGGCACEADDAVLACVVGAVSGKSCTW